MTKTHADFPELNERERVVFNALMRSYIETAEPVGSRKLARQFNLSPATIRNIMSDLEEYGLLEQPHISSGRVPSDAGYRFFVDHFVRMDAAPAVPQAQKRQIQQSLDDQHEFALLMQQVSETLSKLTNFAGFVVPPKIVHTIYKRIQFIRIDEFRVLAILVSASGIVQNKVVVTHNDFHQDDLDQITKFLNERFENKTLQEMRTELLKMSDDAQSQYTKLLESASLLGEKTLEGESTATERVFIGGTMNILELPEFKDLTKLKDMFRTLSERQKMIRLIDQCLDEEGVSVAIGGETNIPEIRDMSIVSSKYEIERNVSGGLGVIGPRRMPYESVIALVAYMARVMSYILRNSPQSNIDPDLT